MEEIYDYRDTGWYNVKCTRDGKFVRNGRELKPRSSYNCSPYIVVKSKGERPKQKCANILVAMAWSGDWKEGCHIIPKDGNQSNICLDNLHVADLNEFASYKAERRKNPNAGVIDWNKYGEFKRTHIDGLECTIDGIFRRNNRIVPLQKGRRLKKGGDGLLYIHYIEPNGCWTTTTAARLVAQTWSPKMWHEDCLISYKDGNPMNIHSDNLILVDEHKFRVMQGKVLGKGNMCDFKKACSIVERRAKEAQIAMRWFQTGCMDELNEYVRTELLVYVEDYVNSFGYKPRLKRKALAGVFSILYDWILSYRPLTNYSVFCKKLVRIYMKKNNFGVYDIPPKPIAREYVSQLNLDSLCERYKCTKIK